MSYSKRSRYASRSPSPSRHHRLSQSRSVSSRSSESDVENPGNNLYVTGLSPRITGRELEKHFSSEGKVVDVHLVADPWTRESRGFGFVTMSSVGEAERCLKYLDRSLLEGRVITVEKARRRRGRTPTPGKYLGLRTASGRRRSPSYSPYRRSHSRYSSERERSRSYSRRRSLSRSHSPYGRRDRSYSPYYSRYRSPDDGHYRRYYGYYRRPVSRSLSPRERRYYSRRSYSRSISPEPRSWRRSYSRSITPEPRKSWRRSYSQSMTPEPRRSRRRSYSRSASLRSRSYSRSVSPERMRSRSRSHSASRSRSSSYVSRSDRGSITSRSVSP